MADVTLKALLLGDDFSASRALKGVAREIDDVVERLVALSRMDATPEVKVRTAEAQAELAKLQAEMDALSTSTETVNKRTEETHKQMGALATAAIALGPALVPIAAGAAGLAAGFSAMGAAGVLAVVGIKQQMEAGTTLGKQYSASLNKVRVDMSALAAVAAAGVLKPFQGEVARLQTQMPALTRIIAEMSVATGHTAANITNGLVSAFIALEPLMRDVAVYALNLSQRFEAMMSGPGVVAFGTYARSVLPQVVSTLESLVSAAVHLVAAFAPLGLGTLSTLRTLSDLLSAIPVDVLSSVATLATSVFIGFRAWQGLSALIGPVSKALDAVKVSEEGVALAAKGMNIAFGVVGVAIAAFSMISASNAEANRQNQQTVNDLTDALIASNGVLDEHVRKVQYDNLVSSGAMDTYKALGGNVRDLTDAALGQVDAQARVNTVLAAAKPAADDFGAAGVMVNGVVVALTDATGKVHAAVGGANGAFKAGQQAQQDYAAATAGATGAVKASTLAIQSTTKATQADKAAINALNSAIDEMLGKNLSLAQSQTNVDQATLNLTDALKKNKGSLNQHTAAGIADRQAIEQTASALQSQRDAQIRNGMSVADATRKYGDNSAALLRQIGRLDGTKSAAYAYAKQLLAIPKSVNTAIRANAGQAISATQQVLNNLAAIHNKSVDVTVNYLNAANKPKIGSNASGTPSWRGGLTWVGEQGPELMDLPAGTRIWSHAQSTQMIASGSHGDSSAGVGGATANLTINLRAADGRLMQQELLRLKLNSGGQLGLA